MDNSAIVTEGPDRLNIDPVDDPNGQVSSYGIVNADPEFNPTGDPSHPRYFQVTNTEDYDGSASDGTFLRGGAPGPATHVRVWRLFN